MVVVEKGTSWQQDLSVQFATVDPGIRRLIKGSAGLKTYLGLQ